MYKISRDMKRYVDSIKLYSIRGDGKHLGRNDHNEEAVAGGRCQSFLPKPLRVIGRAGTSKYSKHRDLMLAMLQPLRTDYMIESPMRYNRAILRGETLQPLQSGRATAENGSHESPIVASLTRNGHPVWPCLNRIRADTEKERTALIPSIAPSPAHRPSHTLEVPASLASVDDLVDFNPPSPPSPLNRRPPRRLIIIRT
jgi:hypothetical protein